MRGMTARGFGLVACLAAVVGVARADVEAWALRELASVRAGVGPRWDMAAAAARAAEVFDVLIAHHPDPAASGALGDSFAVSLHLRYLAEGGDAGSAELAGWLLEHPAASNALAAVVEPGADKMAAVYAVLDDLRREVNVEGNADAAAELFAAAAVVFDAGAPAALIEQEVADPATAVEIVGHLLEHRRGAGFDVTMMPADLLVHVVDARVSAADLAWAAATYRGDRVVGQRFHDLSYDTGLIGLERVGKPLEGAGSAFGLAMLRQCGGVCRHQAFFAASVGKAIGVPTVYMRANGPSVGHAWVGYLRAQGKRVVWDMSEGRFDFYEEVRGEIVCPQTQRRVGDQEVSMKAGLVGVPLEKRVTARALAAAAERIAAVEAARMAWPPALPEGAAAETVETGGDGAPQRARPETAPARRGAGQAKVATLPRAADTTTRLALLEASVNKVPAAMYGWRVMTAWAGEMTAEDRAAWFDALNTLVGRTHPDVLSGMVMPLICSVEDDKQRESAWEWLEKRLAGEAELLAEAAVVRGKDLAGRGHRDAAWRVLSDAAVRYVREAPAVTGVLEAAADLAKDMPSGPSAIADLYGAAFQAAPRADGTLPAEYGPWTTRNRIGILYYRWLKVAGREAEAQRVAADLASSIRINLD